MPRLRRLSWTAGGELFARDRRQPGAFVITACADLGDDGEVVGVGVQRFLDDPVGDVRAVEVRSVDVIDAGLNGFAEHRDGFRAVAWRTKDALAGQLHGAVAHTVDGALGSGEGKGAAKLRLCHCHDACLRAGVGCDLVEVRVFR